MRFPACSFDAVLAIDCAYQQVLMPSSLHGLAELDSSPALTEMPGFGAHAERWMKVVALLSPISCSPTDHLG